MDPLPLQINLLHLAHAQALELDLGALGHVRHILQAHPHVVLLPGRSKGCAGR